MFKNSVTCENSLNLLIQSVIKTFHAVIKCSLYVPEKEGKDSLEKGPLTKDVVFI